MLLIIMLIVPPFLAVGSDKAPSTGSDELDNEVKRMESEIKAGKRCILGQAGCNSAPSNFQAEIEDLVSFQHDLPTLNKGSNSVKSHWRIRRGLVDAPITMVAPTTDTAPEVIKVQRKLDKSKRRLKRKQKCKKRRRLMKLKRKLRMRVEGSQTRRRVEGRQTRRRVEGRQTTSQMRKKLNKMRRGKKRMKLKGRKCKRRKTNKRRRKNRRRNERKNIKRQMEGEISEAVTLNTDNPKVSGDTSVGLNPRSGAGTLNKTPSSETTTHTIINFHEPDENRVDDTVKDLEPSEDLAENTDITKTAAATTTATTTPSTTTTTTTKIFVDPSNIGHKTVHEDSDGGAMSRKNGGKDFDARQISSSFISSIITRSDGHEKVTEVLMDGYIRAYRKLFTIFDFFGVVFAFAKTDMDKKINILENLRHGPHAKRYDTFNSMFKYEYDEGIALPGHEEISGVRENAWIHRALKFILEIIRTLGDTKNTTPLSDFAKDLYTDTMAPHHSWLVRMGVYGALYSFPSRETLRDVMNIPDNSEGMHLINDLTASIEIVYNAIQSQYDKYA